MIERERPICQEEIFEPNNSVNIMTQDAYEFLKRSLENAQEKLAESRRDVGEAGGTSDWHDNFALEEAHRQIDLWSSVIATKRGQLDNVVLVAPRQETDKVGLGNKVELRFENEDENETFLLLGPVDATFRDECISFKTPVGQKILGQTPGAVIELQLGDETTRVKIVRVLPGDFQ